jgi:hypothetical protein
VRHANFTHQAGSSAMPRRVIDKSSGIPASFIRASAFIATNLSRPTPLVVALRQVRQMQAMDQRGKR